MMKKLVRLDEGKATGPDKISVKLLKFVAPSIALSLTSFLTTVFLQGSSHLSGRKVV